MNKRLIARLLGERVPGIRRSGIYFFRGDFSHVLRGVVLEYVPRGVYVEDFHFPLFDFFSPNLNYSPRLSGRSFVGKDDMSEADFVDFVLSAPEVRSTFAADAPMSIQAFVDYLTNSDAYLSPYSWFVHGAALILLNDDVQAAKLLDKSIPLLHEKLIPRCNQLRLCLRHGHDHAVDLLADVRKRNLATFGLS